MTRLVSNVSSPWTLLVTYPTSARGFYAAAKRVTNYAVNRQPAHAAGAEPDTGRINVKMRYENDVILSWIWRKKRVMQIELVFALIFRLETKVYG